MGQLTTHAKIEVRRRYSVNHGENSNFRSRSERVKETCNYIYCMCFSWRQVTKQKYIFPKYIIQTIEVITMELGWRQNRKIDEFAVEFAVELSRIRWICRQICYFILFATQSNTTFEHQIWHQIWTPNLTPNL